MTTATPTLERHLEACFAEARNLDQQAMQALTAGDAETAERNWATASLLRISATMLSNGMVSR